MKNKSNEYMQVWCAEESDLKYQLESVHTAFREFHERDESQSTLFVDSKSTEMCDTGKI